jgi:hypothetical protein
VEGATHLEGGVLECAWDGDTIAADGDSP